MRGREGRAAARPSRSSPRPRARVRAGSYHRVPQGARCPRRSCATVRRPRSARSSSWSPRSGVTGCSWSCGTTATRWTGRATTRSALLAARTGVEVVATNNVHYATPDRRRLATALAAIRVASQPRRARRLAAGHAVRPPAQPGRAAPALRPVSGRGRADRRHRGRVRVRPQGRGAEPARLPGARRPHRHELVARAHPARRGRVLPAHPRALRAGDAPDRLRARRDRAARLPRLLPAAARHRRVLPDQRHLLPGPGERGEQRGLLRARGHQGRCRRARPALRAVPLHRARRPARHRPRHRAPTPRGGDPVRLREVRAGPRRAGGERHHLPAALGAARDGEGRGALARPRRRDHPLDRPVALPARARSTTSARARTRRPSPSSCSSSRTRCRTSPATSASTPAGWSWPTGRSWSAARWSGRAWRTARCSSGTRTTARPRAW